MHEIFVVERFMPISQRQFYLRTSAFLAAGLILLVVIVACSLYLTERTSANFDRVVATRELRSSAADLMSVLTEAESGQRGYLLTQDERYLAPYRLALGRLETMLERLEQAQRNVTGTPLDFAELKQGVETKIAELEDTVREVDAGNTQAALETLRSGTGLALMTQIREKLNRTLSTSEAELQIAIADQERIGAWLRNTTIFGALALLAMAVAAAVIILRYTREIVDARSEVEAANSALEARVQERTQDLMKANEEIQRFAYIVTHDLRAPLVNIMGFTSELEATFEPVRTYLEKLPDADPRLKEAADLAMREDVPEAITFIRSSTRKMDGLINAILRISREGRRTLKPERVDLAEVVETATGAVHHQTVEDGGEIVTELRAGSIVTDRLSLDQMLGNLLDNAIKYRNPGRPLRVVVRTRQDAFGRVLIEVEDNGRGIASTDHERVFELFRRSGKQDRPGEGIGLAHVRTLARNLGGDINVASELGVGSTFTISLPADIRTVKRSIESA